MSTSPEIQSQLTALYYEQFGEAVMQFNPLPAAGSNRAYFRLNSRHHSAIGTFAPNLLENKAFFTFTHHFRHKGLPVPALYCVASDERFYLQEDLGDTSLYSLLPQSGSTLATTTHQLYKKAVTALAHLQIKGAEGLDWSVCYPRAAFDRQSMQWDCNHFKYYGLNPTQLPYSEEALEKDFATLISWLERADSSHFMFRDFQSRNIFIRDDTPWFIDYQGGRKGALPYDLVSLLFQAKANLSPTIRLDLLNTYIAALQSLKAVDVAQFQANYYGFALIRTLQVLGSYGLRGVFERKPHFLSSIPFALNNAAYLFENKLIEVSLPTIWQVLRMYKDKFAAGTLPVAYYEKPSI